MQMENFGPTAKAAYALLIQIEELGASEALTKASGMAHDLMVAVAKLEAQYAAPAAQPDGYVRVPKEVLHLYQFMDVAFSPMTSQQEQIKISLDKARKAVAAQGVDK